LSQVAEDFMGLPNKEEVKARLDQAKGLLKARNRRISEGLGNER
jgi:hypothetical protein